MLQNNETTVEPARQTDIIDKLTADAKDEGYDKVPNELKPTGVVRDPQNNNNAGRKESKGGILQRQDAKDPTTPPGDAQKEAMYHLEAINKTPGSPSTYRDEESMI